MRFGSMFRRKQHLVPTLLALTLTQLANTTTGTALAGPRVQVRGTSRIEMHAWGPADRLTITGTVRDEIGAAAARARLVLAALGPQQAPIAWTSIHPCGQPPPAVAAEHTDHVADTDDSGAFCVVASLDWSHVSIRATFGGDVLHEPTRTEIVWDAAQRAMELMFSPRPDRIDLDSPRARIAARIVVPPDVRVGGNEIRLEDDKAHALATARTDDQGVVLFDVPTAAFGGPGIGTLRAVFSGTQDLSATEVAASVTRIVRVRLQLDRDHVQGDTSAGVQVQVRATGSRGPVQEGAVEAVAGTERVGVAPVQQGQANVVVSFARPRADRTKVQLRFVSDAPYYQPGDGVDVTVQNVASSTLLRYVPVLVAAGVAAWLVRGWRRPKRREQPRVGAALAPLGHPSIEVLASSGQPYKWKGTVRDAHDGDPIAHARVRVIAPSFVELDVVCEAMTDERGAFEFEIPGSKRELRMRVEAPLHVDLERALPPASELVISLASRRRALLQRLVEWARRAGRPWDAAPEPTPGHVARVADRQLKRRDVAVWADAVESKAYGAEPVDARAEREVKSVEPAGHAPR